LRHAEHARSTSNAGLSSGHGGPTGVLTHFPQGGGGGLDGLSVLHAVHSPGVPVASCPRGSFSLVSGWVVSKSMLSPPGNRAFPRRRGRHRRAAAEGGSRCDVFTFRFIHVQENQILFACDTELFSMF